MDDRIKPLRLGSTRLPRGTHDLAQPIRVEIDGVLADMAFVETFTHPDLAGRQIIIFSYKTVFVTEQGFLAFWRRVQSEELTGPWRLHLQAFVRGDDQTKRRDYADALLEFRTHLIGALPEE